jgi:hypothetical protein
LIPPVPSLLKDEDCDVGVGDTVDGLLVPLVLNLPILFNQPNMAGSFPPTHTISTPSKPRSFRPLAHTAAKAFPICLKGTRAVAYFGGLSGCFLVGLIERTIESVSVAPNRDRRVAIDSAEVREGYVFREYLSLTVVSSESVKIK